MSLKKIKEFILDDERDMHERFFVLIMFVMTASWLVTLIEVSVTGGSLRDMLLLALGIVLVTFVTMLAVSTDNIPIGAVMISLGFSLVYLPGTFFLGGGLYGDAPLWFLFFSFNHPFMRKTTATIFWILPLRRYR